MTAAAAQLAAVNRTIGRLISIGMGTTALGLALGFFLLHTSNTPREVISLVPATEVPGGYLTWSIAWLAAGVTATVPSLTSRRMLARLRWALVFSNLLAFGLCWGLCALFIFATIAMGAQAYIGTASFFGLGVVYLGLALAHLTFALLKTRVE